ncbi:MAG: hypothetical protein AAGE52_25490 [Myxococcota bacterium]
MTQWTPSQRDFIRDWLGLDGDIEAMPVAWRYLPAPDADNWALAAIQIAHRERLPELCLQAVFGLSVPLEHPSFGSGDWLVEQVLRDRRGRALCIHDEPFGWTDGGPAGYDVHAVDRFVTSWLDREEELFDIAGAEELSDPLDKVAAQLLEDYRSALPMGGRVPNIIGAEAINEALASLDPKSHARSPSASLAGIQRTGWVVAGLMGQAHLPAGESFDEWSKRIAEWLRAPGETKRATTLLALWASFFLEVESERAVETAKGHSWRLVRDSAALIETLQVEPKIGDVTLVRRSGVAALEAKRKALREAEAAADAAEHEAKTARERAMAETGQIHLVARDPLPAPEFGIEFRFGSQLPDPVRELFRFAKPRQEFRRGLSIGDREWVGTTPKGTWVGIQRGELASNGYRWQLLAGREVPKPVAGVVGDAEFFNPFHWRIRDEHAFCLAHGTLHEIDFVKGKRVLLSWNQGLEPLLLKKTLAFAEIPGGLCTADADKDGRYLRFLRYEVGGTFEVEEEFALSCGSVAFHESTGTLAVSTAAHGLWFARQRGERWSVFWRVDFKPRITKFGGDVLEVAPDGMWMRYLRKGFQVMNLKASAGAQFDLFDLCREPERAQEVPAA